MAYSRLALAPVLFLLPVLGCSMGDVFNTSSNSQDEGSALKTERIASNLVEITGPGATRDGNIIHVSGAVVQRQGMARPVRGYMQLTLVNSYGEVIDDIPVSLDPPVVSPKESSAFSVKLLARGKDQVTVREQFVEGTPKPPVGEPVLSGRGGGAGGGGGGRSMSGGGMRHSVSHSSRM